jgi:hypothetical protein
MKQNNLYNPILITGIERSGSSIVAKIIESCGAFAGNVTEMKENKGIKKIVDSFYTSQLNIPANGQNPLPNIDELDIPDLWGSKINSMLEQDGYKALQSIEMPWMYKSARIAQIWPIWTYNYPNAKWVIVRRRTGDIIQSCMKTGYMKGYSTQEGWLEWVHNQEKTINDLIQSGVNYKVVWPERLAYDDFEQIYEMLDWLGLKPNQDILYLCSNVLKNSLQKERSK